MSSILIYYSQARGNTRRIAQMVQKELGADIEEIQTVIPYTGSYQQIVDQGQREVEEGYKPEIKPLEHDLAAPRICASIKRARPYTQTARCLRP